jgi:hypothetical protein
VKKVVVLGASAVAASAIGLLSAGFAHSQPANPNQMNVIGEPYYKAVKLLHGMGVSTTFGGSVGSDLPQAQCMVTSQKVATGKMILNLDCTEEAAQQMAEQGSLGSGAPGAVGGGTLRPAQIPIGQAPAAPAPAPAPPAG